MQDVGGYIANVLLFSKSCMKGYVSTKEKREMKAQTSRKSMSIQNVTILAFVCLFLVSVAGIEKLVLTNWQSSITRELASISAKMNQDITQKVDSFFRTPIHINEMGNKLIKNRAAGFADEKSLNYFFLSILSSYSKDIYSFTYATAEGEYYGARRKEDGELEIIKNDAETGGESWYYSVSEDMTMGALALNTGKFDPRLREWYRAAVREGGTVFSPVYRHFAMDELAVSVSCPVYGEDGRLLGVLGTHMLLSDISNYLEQAVGHYNGCAAVLEENTRLLIADSENSDDHIIAADEAVKRNAIYDLDVPVMQNGYRKYLASHKAAFPVKNGKEVWYAGVVKYRQPGLDLVIISMIPDYSLDAELDRNIKVTAGLVAIAGILSIGIFTWIVRKLYKPVNGLLASAEGFCTGNMEQRVRVVRNDEIGRISNVFNRLADSMQDLIRHLECIVETRTQELNQANEILKEHQNQLHLILDTTAEAIFGTDLNGRCTFCNRSCLHMLGYKQPEDLLGMDMRIILNRTGQEEPACPEGKQSFTEYLYQGKEGGEKDIVLRRGDGTCFDAECRALPQRKDGKHIGYVITFTDITERKKGEEKIRFLSYHDPLTGLVNRRCFEQEMKRLDTQLNHPISLIFLDLNGLKLINDTFGHTSGDEFIVKVAQILKRNCREGDVAARIGGDEFTVLLPRTSHEAAEAIAVNIKKQVSDEKVNMVSCSIAVGIAAKIKHWQKIERILESAENEMYKEKSISSRNFGIQAIHGIITSLHMKSPWEKTHSEEVSKLCEKIGMAMELPETERKKLRDGAYLHDIGKIVLSETILEKIPEELTEAESEMMRQHPAIGYRILNLSQETLDLSNGVYGHHERWDGSGYPKGLKGEEIPLISRIISVAEAYERILNREKDRETGMEKALKTISEGSGRKYDPAIAELFIRIMRDDI